MSNTLFAVTFDCADAAALARFWAAVLGRQVAEGATSERAVVFPGDGDAGGPRIAFNQVPEPKTVKNRMHLDVISDTFAAETERLLSLGARRLRDVQRDEIRWTTFADIEGNEFDLIAALPSRLRSACLSAISPLLAAGRRQPGTRPYAR